MPSNQTIFRSDTTLPINFQDSVSNKDRSILKRLLKISHDSGGSYSMIAGTRCPNELGFNHIFKWGVEEEPEDWEGRHAEMHLASSHSLKNKVIYVVGHNSSGTVMPNTFPCDKCLCVLKMHDVRRLVFFKDGKPRSLMTQEAYKMIRVRPKKIRPKYVYNI
jgi:hypothetical protein